MSRRRGFDVSDVLGERAPIHVILVRGRGATCQREGRLSVTAFQGDTVGDVLRRVGGPVYTQTDTRCLRIRRGEAPWHTTATFTPVCDGAQLWVFWGFDATQVERDTARAVAGGTLVSDTPPEVPQVVRKMDWPIDAHNPHNRAVPVVLPLGAQVLGFDGEVGGCYSLAFLCDPRSAESVTRYFWAAEPGTAVGAYILAHYGRARSTRAFDTDLYLFEVEAPDAGGANA